MADDLQSQFITTRSAVSQPDDSWMRALASNQGATATTGAPSPAQPAAPTDAPQPPQSSPSLPIGARIINTAGAVAKDMYTGATNIHREVLNGLIDTANDINKFGADVASKLPGSNYGVRLFDKQGNFSPSLADDINPETDALSQAQIPNATQPDSVTGNLIRRAVPFLVTRAGAAKNLAAAGVGGAAKELVADTAAGALTTDPNEQRLSNVIDKVAPNIVTDFLKAPDSEQEDALLGRLKGGLEMAGLGALVHTVVTSFKAVKGSLTGTADTSAEVGAGAAPVADATGNASATPATAEHMPLPGEPQAVPAEEADAGASAPSTDTSPTGDTEASPVAQDTPAADAQANADEPLPGTPGAVAQDAGASPAVDAFDPHDYFAGLETDIGPSRSAQEASQQGEIGDITKPLVTMDENTGKLAQDFADGKTGATPVRINLSKINTPDDIKDAIAQVGSLLDPHQPVTMAETKATADFLGSSGQIGPDQFTGSFNGQALNSAQMVGLRNVLASSAGQLIDYAAKASNPETASDESKALFLRAFATHRAIQQYAQDAQAEAGRTLNSFKILSQPNAQYSTAIKNIINGVGEGDVDKLVSQINDLNDPLRVSRYVANAANGPSQDLFSKIWYNMLLSDPRTIVKKLASDVGMAAWNVGSRYVAETTGNNVPAGETAQLLYGYLGSMRDGFRLAGTALRTGESQFYSKYQTMDGMDGLRTSLMNDSAPAALSPDQPTQAATNYLKGALPTSWIGAADDLAKYTNYRAELRGLAYRDGVGEQGLTDPNDIQTHISDMMNNPTPELHQAAISAALKTTFQEPLSGMASSLALTMEQWNVPVAGTSFSLPMGRILMPFLKVPVNIMKWSYNNSVLPLAFPSASFKAELASSGAAKDIAYAKMGLGTAASMALGTLAYNGLMTGRGPSDPQMQRAWRDAGNQPYSIKVGNDWYGYNSLEPLGLMAGAVADTHDIFKFAKDDENESLAGSMAFGFGNALLSKSYLSGLGNFFEALNDPDRSGKRYADQLVNSLVVPRGSAALERATDEWSRAHYGMLDGIERSLPGVAQGLPVQRTLWGDPVPTKEAYAPFFGPDSGIAKLLSPVPFQPGDEAQPIDKWIWDNRMAFPKAANGVLGITKPPMTQTYTAGSNIQAQVRLSPTQYDRLQYLSGNGLKNPSTGMGAKDTLNALVTGTYPDAGQQAAFDRAPPAQKAVAIASQVTTFRQAAQKQLLAEDAQLRDTVQGQWQARAAQLQGMPNQ